MGNTPTSIENVKRIINCFLMSITQEKATYICDVSARTIGKYYRALEQIVYDICKLSNEELSELKKFKKYKATLKNKKESWIHYYLLIKDGYVVVEPIIVTDQFSTSFSKEELKLYKKCESTFQTILTDKHGTDTNPINTESVRFLLKELEFKWNYAIKDIIANRKKPIINNNNALSAIKRHSKKIRKYDKKKSSAIEVILDTIHDKRST